MQRYIDLPIMRRIRAVCSILLRVILVPRTKAHVYSNWVPAQNCKTKACINDKGKAPMMLETTGPVLLKESEHPYTVNGQKCRYRPIPPRIDLVYRVRRGSESNELGIMFGPRRLPFHRYYIRDTHIDSQRHRVLRGNGNAFVDSKASPYVLPTTAGRSRDPKLEKAVNISKLANSVKERKFSRPVGIWSIQ